jgi:hypothetical protein
VHAARALVGAQLERAVAVAHRPAPSGHVVVPKHVAPYRLAPAKPFGINHGFNAFPPIRRHHDGGSQNRVGSAVSP